MNPIYLDIGREFHLWNDGKLRLIPRVDIDSSFYILFSLFFFFFFTFTLSSCNNIYLTTNPSFNVVQIRLNAFLSGDLTRFYPILRFCTNEMRNE